MIKFQEYKQQINALRTELDTLRQALRLDETRSEIAALEKQTESEGFWNDRENSQRVQQQLKKMRDKIESFDRITGSYDDIATLCQMAIEEGDESLLSELGDDLGKFCKDLETAKLKTLLTGEYDNCSAIVSFHPGAGGTEAQDWAQMLFRMYTRWAEKHGMKYKLLDWLDGDEAGLKSASIQIDGDNAYGFLRSESGVHRLVRISPFDASGRRHTSFAAVEVTPLISDDVELDIRSEDLKVDTYRSQGAGGQNVNKVESAVRITHLPTGLVTACQIERSQHRNKEIAMQMLRSKLFEIKRREHLEKIDDIKGAQLKIEWGSQIRSYVFMPYSLVKDNRTGFETGNITAVMDGEIDGFIESFLGMNTP